MKTPKLHIRHMFIDHAFLLHSKSKRGMTVVCMRDPENDKKVFVFVAFCSSKDHYCRKIGIKTAKQNIPFHVKLRDLPVFLARLAKDNRCPVGSSKYDWLPFAFDIVTS